MFEKKFKVEIKALDKTLDPFKALQRYIKIGRLIHKDEIIRKIEDSLDLMASNENCGYCALAVPSMTGKTQASFALTKKVIYINFPPMTQAIYRCFISISEAFVNALQTDYYYARNLITKDLVTLSNVKDLFDGKKGESKFLGLLLEVVKKFENDRLKNKNIHWSAVLTEQFTFSYFSCSISSL